MFHDGALGQGGADLVRRKGPAVRRQGVSALGQDPSGQGNVVGDDDIAGEEVDVAVFGLGVGFENRNFRRLAGQQRGAGDGG